MVPVDELPNILSGGHLVIDVCLSSRSETCCVMF